MRHTSYSYPLLQALQISVRGRLGPGKDHGGVSESKVVLHFLQPSHYGCDGKGEKLPVRAEQLRRRRRLERLVGRGRVEPARLQADRDRLREGGAGGGGLPSCHQAAIPDMKMMIWWCYDDNMMMIWWCYDQAAGEGGGGQGETGDQQHWAPGFWVFDSHAASSAREIYFWLLGAWSVRARLTFECRCHNWETDVAANWWELQFYL